MAGTMRSTRRAVLMAAVAGALLSLPPIGPAAFAAQDQQSQASSDAAGKLNKGQFKNVKVTVENGIGTLAGTVELYVFKADAEKRVLKAKGVSAVRNLIEVAGTSVPDEKLEATLREKLAYDRVGYGNVFDAIGVSVKNGVVTVGGHAHNYVDRDSAIALIGICPGVKDVVGEIEVDPTSLMDDQTRMAVARAVYGYPSLTRYSMNPAMPIRISVQNGNVELYGTVDSQGDKDAAYLRASGVGGVFSVKNNLNVANQPSETQK